MAKGANTTKIGAFVVIGIVLAVAAVAIFGSGSLFRESRQFVLNFSASMQGLSRGSPVMFNGVPIGEVSNIVLRLNEETLAYDSAVLISIYPDRFQSEALVDRKGGFFDKLVDKGLRGRLVPVSIVTGQLGIELGFYPGTPVRLSGSMQGLDEIPTIPSTVERLETTMQKILNAIEAADFEALSAHVDRTLQSVSNLLSMPELRGTIVDASGAVSDLRVLLAQLKTDTPVLLSGLHEAVRGTQSLIGESRSLMPTLRADIQNLGPALEKLDALLVSADTLTRSMNATMTPDSPLQTQLAGTMRELARTSASVRSLVTGLQDNPNSILFGSVERSSE